MAGHALTKELVSKSPGAETTQNPDIVEEDNPDGADALSSDPMPAILASSTGLHPGKYSDNRGMTSPIFKPPSSGELFSMDEFLSELDEDIEPSLVHPQSDGKTRVQAASFRDQFSNPPWRTTTASSRPPSITQHSVMIIRSIFRHSHVSAATLASATAFYSEYLESRPYKTYSVRTFCESLFDSRRAVSAEIVSVKRYGHRFGVPHRFLIFHIVRTDGKDFYLRVDRRPDHDIPLWEFGIQNLGRSNAVDTVAISGQLDHLHDYTQAKEEAVMTFPNPAPLSATARILYAIAVESQGYSLTKENCWFFTSVIQEVLIGKFGGRYESGSLNNPRFGKGVRPSIICRVYFGSTALAGSLSRDGKASELMRNLYCVRPDQYRRNLAQRLQHYGASLHGSGLSEAARDAVAEAVELTRELYRVHPDQYCNNLAEQLQNYGVSLRSCGLSEAACGADAEAVKLTRTLYRTHPDQYRSDLAQRLENHAYSFRDCGLSEAACDADVKAVELTRILYLIYPDRYRNHLAQRLGNYGVSLRSCGLSEAACNAHAEAVELTRELCRVHPDQYRNNLAQQLQNHGVSLRSCGLSEAARDADAEAVELTRELYRVHPDLYRNHLARQLQNYGVSLRSCGLSALARNVNAEAVGLTRELYHVHPDQYRSQLAQQLQNYAYSFRDYGLSQAARDADTEAVGLTRILYRVHPDQYRHNLAQRLQNYGVSLRSCGLSEAARDANAEAVELTRELYRVHPDQYRNDLAQRLHNNAYSFRDCGQSEAARNADAEAVELTRPYRV